MSPGIGSVEVDTERGRISVAYDSTHLTSGDVEQLARRMATVATDRDAHCTMHVDGMGSRSCESCAIALGRRGRRACWSPWSLTIGSGDSERVARRVGG
ncbi:MAG: hypothetical protein RI560_05515 [Natronomonas sp.]|nr:hypothetical protein [Natronomonas sp.]